MKEAELYRTTTWLVWIEAFVATLITDVLKSSEKLIHFKIPWPNSVASYWNNDKIESIVLIPFEVLSPIRINIMYEVHV